MVQINNMSSTNFCLENYFQFTTFIICFIWKVVVHVHNFTFYAYIYNKISLLFRSANVNAHFGFSISRTITLINISCYLLISPNSHLKFTSIWINKLNFVALRKTYTSSLRNKQEQLILKSIPWLNINRKCYSWFPNFFVLMMNFYNLQIFYWSFHGMCCNFTIMKTIKCIISSIQ
jgi:hypothetical protein